MDNSDFTLFDGIIWSGAAVALLGLLGITWCIVTVFRAKRSKLSDAALQATVQRVLPFNLGALFLSVLGLMLVGIGIAFS